MSWWGGGEMSPMPGWVWRRLAISSETLAPGIWPPSPGFEPWAILMFSSSANAQYSGVTPKRLEEVGGLELVEGLDHRIVVRVVLAPRLLQRPVVAAIG